MVRRMAKRKKPRKYTGVLQYFHNYEHDPKGRTHCKSNGEYPYTIRHSKGRHIISSRVAKGHGRGGKSQTFRFKRKLEGGYDMASGEKV